MYVRVYTYMAQGDAMKEKRRLREIIHNSISREGSVWQGRVSSIEERGDRDGSYFNGII